MDTNHTLFRYPSVACLGIWNACLVVDSFSVYLVYVASLLATLHCIVMCLSSCLSFICDVEMCLGTK